MPTLLGRLRLLVECRRRIATRTGAVIQDEQGRILYVARREDNPHGLPAGSWCTPGGHSKRGELALDCLKRVVKEETGLAVISAEPLIIYNRRFVTNMYLNSDQLSASSNETDGKSQNRMILYRVDKWNGTLLPQTTTTTNAQFFSLEELSGHDRIFMNFLLESKSTPFFK